jgi:hypothetical protein
LTDKTSFEKNHEDNLESIEREFVKLKAIACASGKINDCSLGKICMATGVSTSYFGGKQHKPKSSPELSERYNEFARRVTTWRKEFSDNLTKIQEDSEISKACNQAKLAEAERDASHMQCADLISHNEKLRSLLSNKDKQVSSLHASAQDIGLSKIEQKKARLLCPKEKIISPDHHLTDKNGNYQFDDKALRDVAWVSARHNLIALLRRPNIAMRVYLLVGMSAAGKSRWASEYHYFHDRHPVVIDATSLTKKARAKWLAIIANEKYKPNADITCFAVVFDVPYSTLIDRNVKHREIDEGRYLELFNSMEQIDFLEESFDGAMVVRHE